MVICLELGADLHMAQLMPLPLTVSCFSKIQIGFAFLVPAHQGSPGKGPLNVRACSHLHCSTGKPRTRCKTIIGPFPGVRRQTGTEMFSVDDGK